jgi:hypothetical protein
MTLLDLDLLHLAEPLLQFGGGREAQTPKEGLLLGGPYDLRFGAAHRSEVRVGLVGPRDAVGGMRDFLRRVAAGLPAKEGGNPALFPPFPGFKAIFRAELVRTTRWDVTFAEGALEAALRKEPRVGFIEAVDMYAAAIDQLAARDVAPDVVVCCVPKELRKRIGLIETASAASARGRRFGGSRTNFQGTLFDSVGPGGEPMSLEAAADPQPEDQLTRNFRSALKARAMESAKPMQIATEALWRDARGTEDPATRAWNFSVALFYKAGGVPWRADMRVDDACFVGISFHHLRTQDEHVMYSSLAQAFSSDGEGFALRGESVPYDEETRQAYLTRDKAHSLMATVLDAYRNRAGRDPVRVVIHKTTAFTEEERAGIDQALESVPSTHLITVRSNHDFRLIRHGTYPPHRGALCRVADTTYLYTVGYQPQHLTYPGPHVPVPIEIVTDVNDVEAVADDLLCLTKMNWNSARSAAALPVTLSFARKVGAIISEVPPGVDHHPSFRYYM